MADEGKRFENILDGFDDVLARVACNPGRAVFERDGVVDRLLGLARLQQPFLLIGRHGVGKSALVEELARRVVIAGLPEASAPFRVYRASVPMLMAGTVYAGWWQTKVDNLVEEIANQEEPVLLVLVDFVNLFRESRGDRGRPIAEDLYPYIEQGRLWLAGEVTPEDYAAIARDGRWARMFERVAVDELDSESVLRVLRRSMAHRGSNDTMNGGRPATERNVRAAVRHAGRASATTAEEDFERALEQAMELTYRFLPSVAQPGASLAVLRHTLDGERLEPPAVQRAVSMLTGVPLAIISDGISMATEDIREQLNQRVIGQGEAVAAVADTVAMVKAGLTDPRRPLWVAAFLGPSGVGKTELATALASLMFGSDHALVRFDMSEYVGAPSAITFAAAVVEKVGRVPMSVCLFDEIEKAELNALDVLLQIMSDGRCTDADGRTISLRQSIVILTSNVGFGSGREESARPTGFVGHATEQEARPRREREVSRALSERFRPEFIGRIDRILMFSPLDHESLCAIAERELQLARVRPGFASRNIGLAVDQQVVDWLAASCRDARYGARPLVARVRNEILVPIARQVAGNPAIRNALATVDLNGGRLTVELRSREPEPS